MTHDIFVFDRNIVRKNRNRCAKKLEQHGFLIDWSMDQMRKRLKEINKKFPTALQIGKRSTVSLPNKLEINNFITLDLAKNLSPNIIADEELLPFANNSFDLIISPLNLHTTNDLPGTLSQIQNVLKPDGLFIATLFGGETLHELRESMNAVEIKLSGGNSPHIAPFADMPQMGALMQRAGFNLPVIDSEKITVTYDNALKLMEDIRNMGEGNAIIERKKHFSSYEYFGEVVQDYASKYSEKDGRIKATFEIIFMAGWSPHESQQKPLKPGSAKTRLADTLNSKEETLQC